MNYKRLLLLNFDAGLKSDEILIFYMKWALHVYTKSIYPFNGMFRQSFS